MGSSGTDDSVEISPACNEEQSNKVPPPARKSMHQPPPVPRRLGSTGEERWIFKGRASLVDIEVTLVSSREIGDERRFEVLSPEGSFVLYAGMCPLFRFFFNPVEPMLYFLQALKMNESVGSLKLGKPKLSVSFH
jgi:hypothetical protein